MPADIDGLNKTRFNIRNNERKLWLESLGSIFLSIFSCLKIMTYNIICEEVLVLYIHGGVLYCITWYNQSLCEVYPMYLAKPIVNMVHL